MTRSVLMRTLNPIDSHLLQSCLWDDSQCVDENVKPYSLTSLTDLSLNQQCRRVGVLIRTLNPIHSHLLQNCDSSWLRQRSFSGHFPGQLGVSRYQNVSILDFIGAKDDDVMVTTGGIRRAVKSSPPTKPTTQLFTGRMPFCRSTNSVGELKGKISHSTDLLTLRLTCGSSILVFVQ